MQQLLDGDPASNNGGWQWTAGTGTDAAPYFRVFNPILQGRKFDPDGAYVHRWVPELARVPDKYIHAPWEMPTEVQQVAGCRVGWTIPCRLWTTSKPGRGFSLPTAKTVTEPLVRAACAQHFDPQKGPFCGYVLS